MPPKVPSFKGLEPASEVSSRTKRSNKRHDTKHELLLRRALWQLGLRFRIHVNSLPGKPDIVFPTLRVVVFCDGDFWHGRNRDNLNAKLAQGTNASYWVAKIASNVERDLRNNAQLEEAGWHVIRLWESDIKKDPKAAAVYVRKVLEAQSQELQHKGSEKS